MKSLIAGSAIIGILFAPAAGAQQVTGKEIIIENCLPEKSYIDRFRSYFNDSARQKDEDAGKLNRQLDCLQSRDDILRNIDSLKMISRGGGDYSRFLAGPGRLTAQQRAIGAIGRLGHEGIDELYDIGLNTTDDAFGYVFETLGRIDAKAAARMARQRKIAAKNAEHDSFIYSINSQDGDAVAKYLLSGKPMKDFEKKRAIDTIEKTLLNNSGLATCRGRYPYAMGKAIRIFAPHLIPALLQQYDWPGSCGSGGVYSGLLVSGLKGR